MAKQWIKIGNVSGGGAYIGLLSKGDGLTIEKDVKEEYYINSVHPVEAKDSKINANGELTIPLKPADGFDELLYCFFGLVATTDLSGVGSGPYEHKFTVKAEDIPEFEIIKAVGSIQEKYSGVKVQSIELSADATGEGEVKVKILAKTGDLVSGETEESYTKSKTFSIKNASLLWGGVSYGVGALTLNLSRDLDGDGFAFNTDSGRTYIPEGNFKATAKLDVLADDVIFLQDFLNGTAKAFELTMQTADGDILKIALPNAIITGRDKSTEVDKKLLIENVEIIGLEDLDGSAVVTLTNTITAYPRT